MSVSGLKNFTVFLPHTGGLSGLLVSLKTRNFRLYFAGMCVSLIGTWMQQIAMSWLVYELTGSVILLATVAFSAQIPILLVTPFVSVFVDRFDRRKILVLTQSLSAIQALLLAFLTFTGSVQVWHLIALSVCIGCINSLDNPTRQSFYPSLVPKENLANAIALNSAVINGARLIGPGLGGVFIGIFGESLCFLINGVSFAAVIIALYAMKLPRFVPKNVKRHIGAEMAEGFNYVRGNVPIRTTLLVMSVMSFFGLPLMTFIPAFVKDILSGDSQVYGLLLSCFGIGSFMAAVLLAATKSVRRLPYMLTITGVLLSVCIVGISFVRVVWLSALVCVPIGFCMIWTIASINTMLQTISDERVRGRVMGYLAMAFVGISPLGSMFLGYLETFVGLTSMITITGICCLFGILWYEVRRRSNMYSLEHYNVTGV